MSLSYKLHAKERLAERGLIVSDVLHVLKHGFVHGKARPATRAGFYRYRMEHMSPNSGGRSLGVVVIPQKRGCALKIVTVMWIDETSTKAGNIGEWK